MGIRWNLKKALVTRFGSQVDAAKMLGLREGRLSSLVRGHTQPKIQELRVLESEFGKDVLKKLLRQAVK